MQERLQVWDRPRGRAREHGGCRDKLKARTSCWEARLGGRGGQEEQGRRDGEDVAGPAAEP